MKVKFLVSWIEDPNFTRGQTCQDKEEADRLYDHVKDLLTTRYAEIRRIGEKLKHYSRPETKQ